MPHPDNIRLLLVIVSILLLFGMVRRPFYGLLSYLIVMMTRPGLFYEFLGNIRIELCVALLVMAVMAFSQGRLRRVSLGRDQTTKWMWLLYGVILISMIQAVDIAVSWERVYDFSKIVILFAMVVTLVDSQEDLRKFVLVFSVVTTAIAYDAIYSYVQGDLIEAVSSARIDYSVASEGMGSGHVALANLTLQGMPILWFVGILGGRGLVRIGAVALFLICLTGVVVSGSRGGFVGLLVFVVCIAGFSKHRLRIGLVGLLLLVVIGVWAPAGYMKYMGSIPEFSDTSSSSRITGLRHGLEMLAKRPLLGVGPGCYAIARKLWFGWGLWAHNHYGELMGDLGIIGTVVWFGFLKSYFVRAWHFVRETERNSTLNSVCLAVVVATIVRLVLGMGSHSVYIFFWYMAAGLVVSAFGIAGSAEEEAVPENSSIASPLPGGHADVRQRISKEVSTVTKHENTQKTV